MIKEKTASILRQTENLDKISKVVVSLSGGLDSTILLHLMVKKYGKENVFAISYFYNQRHDIELTLAKKTCKDLDVSHKIVDISFLGEMAENVSAMVKGSVETPTMEDILGDPQPDTYMPNRNMVLASITAAYAETVSANGIALGIQAIDSYSYWDAQPSFYDAIQSVLQLNRKNNILFTAPFIRSTKADEIQIAQELNVDFGNTWTCYNPAVEDLAPEEKQEGMKNRYIPCGICPSCKERAAAFKSVKVLDTLVENNGVIG